MEELCSNYYKANSDTYIKRATKRNKDNPEAARIACRKYHKDNKYQRNRYHSDIQYRLIKIQRVRINDALKGKNKSATTQELIGCTPEFLKSYIESKFQPGMSWNNYAIDGWHIDHIIPISSFDLTDHDQLKKACNYVNLQPMWALDNIQKSNK